MGEWIRHRGSKTMPKRLEGMQFEAKLRNGNTTEGEHIYVWEQNMQPWDVMSYRIIGQTEPATPCYTKGYPRCTTAASIGAKVGDKFVVVSYESSAKFGTIVVLSEDDGSTNPCFHDESGIRRCISWYKLAPLPTKSTIEPQEKEFGIPVPVKEWPEDRIDVIGQNGNTGEHYDEVKMMDGKVEPIPTPARIAWLKEQASNAEEAFDRGVDMVNEPPHYKQGDVECIDAIKSALTPDEWRGYCKGNALKYIWRERHKGGDESLQKADWYLNRLSK